MIEVRRLGLYALNISVALLWLAGCAQTQKTQPHRRHSYYRRSPGVYHTVEKGQTLWRIASTYGVSVEDIARVNNIQDPNTIEAGQRLFIPGASRELKVNTREKASVAKKEIPAASPEPKVSARSSPPPKIRRGVPEESDYSPLEGQFIWPVKGEILTESEENFLAGDGINISAPAGAEIRAAQAGKVVYSDNKMNYYGNMVIIKHQPPYFTVYAHNAENLVQPEQSVIQGQLIARVGKTGRVTVSCLHFEIRKGEAPLNPLSFLPKLE